MQTALRRLAFLMLVLSASFKRLHPVRGIWRVTV
jgi:hypothetical protein